MNATTAHSGPSFGAHAFIWAAEWSREGAQRVISGAAAAAPDFVEIPLLDPMTMDFEHTRALLEGRAFLRAKGSEHGLLE